MKRGVILLVVALCCIPASNLAWLAVASPLNAVAEHARAAGHDPEGLPLLRGSCSSGILRWRADGSWQLPPEEGGGVLTAEIERPTLLHDWRLTRLEVER